MDEGENSKTYGQKPGEDKKAPNDEEPTAEKSPEPPQEAKEDATLSQAQETTSPETKQEVNQPPQDLEKQISEKLLEISSDIQNETSVEVATKKSSDKSSSSSSSSKSSVSGQENQQETKKISDKSSSSSSSSKLSASGHEKPEETKKSSTKSSSSSSSSKSSVSGQDRQEEETKKPETGSDRGDDKSQTGSSKKLSRRSTPSEKKVRTEDPPVVEIIPMPGDMTYIDPNESSRPLLKRRNTVIEEAEESLRRASESISMGRRKSSVKDSWGEVRRDIYNRKYREFMSRDCKGWFKLSVFYFLFYCCLAGFFVLLLLIYYETMIDLKTPSLFNKDSVMNYKVTNPGLGFRPQVDIESELIRVSEQEFKNNFQSLELFLKKYEDKKKQNFTGAHGRKQVYNYEEAIKNTSCSRENHFGYHTQSPCVIVKLNRIYGWLPVASSKTPGNITKVESADKFIYIKCQGEHGTDQDHIHEIEYFSSYPNHDIGGIPFRFFPYRNQPGYLSPLVFVHFKNVSTNVLINVECKAYAHNIDNKDRQNRRGMTKFQLFVSS